MNVESEITKVIYRKTRLKYALLSLLAGFIMLFISCDFGTIFEPDFNSPVKDYFDTYTNHAAIEKHEISNAAYNDSSARLCLDSSQACTVTYFLRNPQKYTLSLGDEFRNLTGINTSSVKIIQSADKSYITLTLPQDFLVDSDEGQDISPTVTLYEPLTGRYFPEYSFSLYCNSRPPVLYNATVMNDSNTSFVIAFDMPDAPELALRHKDLAFFNVGGVNYPLQIDQSGNFTFDDTERFLTGAQTFTQIGDKSFTHTNRSVYFKTGDAFSNGDKEYIITLIDKSGLESQTLASTKITKLAPPSALFENVEISESEKKIISKTSESQLPEIILKEPLKDHLDNPVSGATVHYVLYNKDQSKILGQGNFTGQKVLSLAVEDYILVAYAEKANYEASKQTKFKIRVVDAMIYIEEGADSASAVGTKEKPFASIAAAISDINSEDRNDATMDYILSISGKITENVTLDSSVKAHSITFKNTGSGSGSIDGIVTVSSGVNVGLSGDILLKQLNLSGSLKIGGNACASKINFNNGASITISGNLTAENTCEIKPYLYASSVKILADSAYNKENCEKLQIADNNDNLAWRIDKSGYLVSKKTIDTLDITLYENEIDVDVSINYNLTTNSYTFTASEGFESYTWKLDGVTQTGLTNVLRLDCSDWASATYDVYLVAKKNSKSYSYHAQINYTKNQNKTMSDEIFAFSNKSADLAQETKNGTIYDMVQFSYLTYDALNYSVKGDNSEIRILNKSGSLESSSASGTLSDDYYTINLQINDHYSITKNLGVKIKPVTVSFTGFTFHGADDEGGNSIDLTGTVYAGTDDSPGQEIYSWHNNEVSKSAFWCDCYRSYSMLSSSCNFSFWTSDMWDEDSGANGDDKIGAGASITKSLKQLKADGPTTYRIGNNGDGYWNIEFSVTITEL